MKNNNIYLLSALLISFTVTAQSIDNYSISEEDSSEIETRVNQMSETEAQTRKVQLETQAAELEEEQASTQNPSRLKEISEELNRIYAEISEIQKVFIAALSLNAILELTEDKKPDTIPPVVTLNGSSSVTVERGGVYTEDGAEAFDLASGNLTVSISGTVNTDVVGTYTLTYSATDASGNSASVTRTINVVDTTDPVITVVGDNPATVELGATYTDAGATAVDFGESINVATSGTVNTDVVGTYILTYTATDASGNSSTATRTVNVVDTTAPAVTVTGDATVTVELGGTYTESGATATDASGTVTVVTTGTVDTDTVGSYTVTYTSTDASGNAGTATRTVNVVDTTAPAVTVTGDATVTVELGGTYTESGATATDASGTEQW